MVRSYSWILLGLAPAVGCGPQPAPRVRPDPVRSWAACYELRLGPWEPERSGFQVPRVIRLDSRNAGNGYRRAAPQLHAPAPYQRVTFDARWRPFAMDSLRVIWSDGFGGLGVLLTPDGDSLIGRVRELHDVLGPVFPSAPVTAARVTCPDSLAF